MRAKAQERNQTYCKKLNTKWPSSGHRAAMSWNSTSTRRRHLADRHLPFVPLYCSTASGSPPAVLWAGDGDEGDALDRTSENHTVFPRWPTFLKLLDGSTRLLIPCGEMENTKRGGKGKTHLKKKYLNCISRQINLARKFCHKQNHNQ